MLTLCLAMAFSGPISYLEPVGIQSGDYSFIALNGALSISFTYSVPFTATPKVMFACTGILLGFPMTHGFQSTLIGTSLSLFSMQLRRLGAGGATISIAYHYFSTSLLAIVYSYHVKNSFVLTSTRLWRKATGTTNIYGVVLISLYRGVYNSQLQITVDPAGVISVQFFQPLSLNDFQVALVHIDAAMLNQQVEFTVANVDVDDSTAGPFGHTLAVGVLSGSTMYQHVFLGLTRYVTLLNRPNNFRVYTSDGLILADKIMDHQISYTVIHFNQMCPAGTFYDKASSSCGCPFTNCLTCTASACLTCQPGYYLSFGSCFVCSITCLACKTSSSPLYCLTCDTLTHHREASLYSSPDRYQCLCSSGFVDTGSAVCQACQQDCLVCQLSGLLVKCSMCLAGLWRSSDDLSCLATCPLGQYQGPVAGICLNCNFYCLSCVDDQTCLVCQSKYWLTLKNVCDFDCPFGSYQEFILVNGGHVCLACDISCSICTRYSCEICAHSFLMDKQGNCYKCQCQDCGSCQSPCSTSLLLYDRKCYGHCINGTYQLSEQLCEKCLEPCLECSLSKSNCTACIGSMNLQQNSCLDNCRQLYYADQGLCKYCFQNGVFLKDIEDCSAFIPVLSHEVECASPSSGSMNLNLFSNQSIETGQSSYQLQISYSDQQVGSCIQHVTHITPERMRIRFINKGCRFVGLVVSVSIIELVSSYYGLFFDKKQLQFSWELGLYEQQGVELLHSVYKAGQYMQYMKYLPVLSFLTPELSALGACSMVKDQPYVSYMASSFVGSQYFRPACYKSPSYSKESLAGLLGARMLVAQSTTRFATSGIFYVDFFAGLVYTGVGWLAVAFVYYFNSDATMKAINVVVRLQQAFYLLMAFSMASNLRQLQTTAHIVGLVVGVCYVAYVAGGLVYFTNRLYVLNKEQWNRYIEVRNLPAYLKKVNWLKDRNSNSGLWHILDPIYHRVIGDWLLLLLFLCVAFLEDSILQLSVTLGVALVNLLRLLRVPYMPLWINAVEALQWLLLVVYAVLGIVSVPLYNRIYSIQPFQEADLKQWMRLGWVMAAMLLGFGLVLICKEIAVWGIDDELEEVVYKPDDSLTDSEHLQHANLRHEIKQHMMEQRHMEDCLIELERMEVQVEKDTIYLRIVSVQSMRNSPAKQFVKNDAGLYVKVVRSSLRVNGLSRIYKDLRDISEKQDWTLFNLRTVGEFSFKESSSGEIVSPKSMFNIVTHDNKTSLELKGSRRLDWTPLNFRKG